MTAARKRTLICLATFVIALILACGFSFCPPSVADAALPESWTDAAAGDAGDWYLDGDNLDIDGVKSTVDSWRISAAYDFSALADDPLVIAVIDSGVNPSHDIFGGGGSCPDVFFRDSSGAIVGANTAGGASFVDNASDRHGTHVAGIIAVLIHALDLEDYIKIMPIKAGTPEGTKTSFSLTDVREAITFALSNGADIVNMSLTADSAGWDIVSDSNADAALFVAAAGNDGKSSASGNFYPAESDNVVGVMNYAEDSLGGKTLSSTSNYGSGFDIAAPGNLILSADGSTADRYKQLSGTSMASPVVAFAAALLEVKWRASVFEEVPDGVSEARSAQQALSLHSADTAYSTKDRKYYTALDLSALVGKSFVYSEAKGEMVIASGSVDAEMEVVSGDLTLGRAGTLELGAVLPEGEDAAEYTFVWTVKFGGGNVYYGTRQNFAVSYNAADVATMNTVSVLLEVYSDAGLLVGSDTLVLSPSYADESDFAITVDGKAIGDESPSQSVDSGTVFSVSYIEYASPDAETVWYLDGEEAARANRFAPEFDAAGTHTVKVVVYENGAAVYERSIVVEFNAKSVASPDDIWGKIEQSFEDNRDIYILVGVVLGLAVVIVGAVVVAIVIRRGNRRA